MIDLRDSTVLVNNVEEYIAVTKIAKKQGFRWASGNDLNTVLCVFPTRLEFNRRYETYWGSRRGTTVWDICGMDIRENVVCGIECGKNGKQFLWANHDEWLGELNDLVFLTREAAEKKLEEF